MFKDFLYFTRIERAGVLVLAALALLLLALPRFLPDRSQDDPTDFTALATSISESQLTEPVLESALASTTQESTVVARPFDPNQATVEELQAVGLSTSAVRAWMSYLSKGGQFKDWEAVEKFRALSAKEREQLQPYLLFDDSEPAVARDDVSEEVSRNLSLFDPNTVVEADLIAMGVPAKATGNWVKFLASGGRFKRPEDIEKIYGLPDAVATILIPYVQLPTEAAEVITSNFNEIPISYNAKNATVVIDINQATAAQWQELRGIGPAYSERIVNFRDKLGGFVSVAQVAETYGLPDSTFQAIYLQLRPSAIFRFLPINHLGVGELAAHPYLNQNNARAIVRYREEHGPYKNAEDLGKLYSLTEKVKKNIEPYLSFD